MTFKQKVYAGFLEILNTKIDSFQHAIDELSESILNETKSTAGDKHETALSILQAEQSRLAVHLYEAHDQKTFYCQIIMDNDVSVVKIGSIVKTTIATYFVSVALPKIVIDNITVISISIKSPLGEILLAKKVNDTFTINNNQHTILEIL